MTVAHPCRFTPAVLDALAPVIEGFGLPVHDPFAGTGERLGALCDRLGVGFSGTEIEPEFIVDPRVQPGDSTRAGTYPAVPHILITSPVYPNGMTDHFEARDGSRRHTYRQALATNLGRDRPLHINNMGAYGNKIRRSHRSEQQHWGLATACLAHWPDTVIVNVKDTIARGERVPVVATWAGLLTDAGWGVTDWIVVDVHGQRHGANGHARVDHEVILVAQKAPA